VSLRNRIAGVAGIAVAIAVIAGAAVTWFAIRSELRGEVDTALSQRAEGLTSVAAGLPGAPMPGREPGGDKGPRGDLSDHGPGGHARDIRELGLRAPAFGGAAGYVQFVESDGKVSRPPGETQTLPVSHDARQIARSGSGRRFEDANVGPNHLRVLTTGLTGGGAVQIARPLAEVDRVLDRVLVILVLMGLGGIALAAVLGAGVARAALAPIRRFTLGTEQIASKHDVSRRMDVEGSDELARLASSFNTTLDQLERSVEAQRQLVADAGHELRTPIASLRANIQVLEDADRLPVHELEALRADIVSELDELTALVADVVELARGAKSDDVVDDVRLDLVVVSLVERAGRRGGNGVVFDTMLEPTVVSGQPERIARAVSNLIDNARNWSPPGGMVEIRLRDGELSVRDHGPGFQEKDLRHVFDRFFRSDRARAMPGSGLGLAIVRQAAEAHGGFAEAGNAPGGGALVRVRFGPASAADETLTELIREQ
jgi:two-component system sensor histidine kinase MprB